MVFGYDVDQLPYLLDPDRGTGGTIRNRSEDFYVEEQPLYEINEEGPHLYFEVHKKNLTSNRAARILEDQLDVGPNFEIGYAGRKDKNAVTVQRMSLEHADPEDLDAVDHPALSVSVLGYHRNKLQPGHLAGNRFVVRVRDVESPAESLLDERQQDLLETGVPNYFGPQRFGLRRDTATLGKFMVHDELDEFVEQYLGRPSDREPEACREARKLFEEGDHEDAIDAWPQQYHDKRKALATWIDTKNPKPVLSAISKSTRQLFVSAYQGQLFNELLADRMPDVDRVLQGDIAKKTDTGGMFEVKAPEEEQPRADRLDISPTGLLPGRDPWYASGEPGRSEDDLLERHNLSEDSFESVSYLRTDGERRPFRFPVEAEAPLLDEDEHGPYLQLDFTIPSGSYATVYLRELMGRTPA